MTRREFVGGLAAQLGAARKPNVVLLLADDLGYGECGFQGYSDFATPHLDALAGSGVRFTQGYATAPYCCPSRAGLLTGRYQTRFGHELNVVGKRNLDPSVGLPLREVTLAARLRELGYRTGCVGKWHLGVGEKYHPLSRGFDEFFGFLQEGHFYYPPPYRGGLTRLRKNEPPYDEENPLMRGREVVEEKEYLTDALAREAVGFIERQKREQPFFLYLPFNAVHSPMQAPVQMMGEFEHLRGEQRRLFAAMTRAMDNAVGRVVEKLRERGMEQETLIFFLSDNGGPTAELSSSNQPLRGGKGQLYEGGIRVPFVVNWKGKVTGGRVSHEVVSALDIVPTVLRAAGGRVPAGLDGLDLVPHLEDGRRSVGRESHFWRYGPNRALRRGNMKLVKQGNADWQLFDLGRDVGETTDVSSARSEVKRAMMAEMEAMNREMVEPLWR